MPTDEIGFSFSRNATAGFFPLPESNWRIDVAPTKISGNNKKLLRFENVQQLLNKETQLNVKVREPELFSVFHSHRRYAARFRDNSCFLIGDAAHLYSPVGAQGMNNGLQDAHNLAWKLGLVINGLAKPEILMTYELERKPLARKLARTTNLFFNVVASNNYFYKIFRLYMLPKLLEIFFKFNKNERVSTSVFKRISGTGIRYKPNAN